MKIDIKDFGSGVELGIVRTEKFKTNYFVLSFVLPRTKETVANVKVLSNVLSRGTENYPTMRDISIRLSDLYDVSVNIFSQGIDSVLVFKVSVGFIDDRFIPDTDGVNVCEGAIDFIRELLFRPLLENGSFKSEYVESERARCIDRINAEKNNKDSYAYTRAMSFACEGTPLQYNSNGAMDAVKLLTNESLLNTLDDILNCGRVIAFFAGRDTDENMEKVNSLLSELAEKRDGDFNAEPIEPVELPRLGGKEIIESVKAKQGRMVLTYHIPKLEKEDMSYVVFNEIFGGSPVSRLFTNVRERLSLCYYCSSNTSKGHSLLTIRSGLEKANRQKAIDEIERQLHLLADPENIDDDEISAAKKAALNNLSSLGDSTGEYANWYTIRRLIDADTDIDTVEKAINAVTKEDVAKIAAGTVLQLNYFLDGTEK